MKKPGSKTICILGGMGPEASAKMLSVVVEMASSEFGARNGSDFPDIVLFSVPVADFISDKKKIAPARSMLIEKVKLMNVMDVSMAAIACNTAHILLDDLQTVSKAPFVSIVDAVTCEVEGRGLVRIGLLASPATIGSGLYQNALKKKGIITVCPSRKQISKIEGVIRNVISGTISQRDRGILCKISESLIKDGAEGIILGCTELPLIFPKDLMFPVFDSIEILSRELLRRNYDAK